MYRKGNVPVDPAEIPQFLNQELSNLERAQNEPVFVLRLAVSHTPPAKFSEGDVVEADGADWDPGAGPGMYIYRAGAWVKVG